jgi:hypothetical protein
MHVLQKENLLTIRAMTIVTHSHIFIVPPTLLSSGMIKILAIMAILINDAVRHRMFANALVKYSRSLVSPST